MQIRFISKSLFMTAFITVLVGQFQTFDSISQTLLCSSVLAEDRTPLGKEGDDGNAGGKGANGRNSDNLTVFADGTPMTLDLTGGDGAAGQAGGEGKNVCTSLSKVFDILFWFDDH